MSGLELDFAYLSDAQLDDQAIAEISALFSDRGTGVGQQASSLVSLAAAGQLVVARRPCGSSPEIVGVAARLPGQAAGKVIVAVDEANGALDLIYGLEQRLAIAPSSASLFRRRGRPPLGLCGPVA